MSTGSSPEARNRHRVVVADPIHSEGLARLRRHYDLAVLPEIDSEAEQARVLAAAEAIVVRVFRIDRDLIRVAPKLRLVAKHGSGVDNIDIPAASERGIMVANTPGGANATAVAEGAVALMLAVQRRVCQLDACVRENRFGDRWRLTLHELWGKRLGLVGFGQIARIVARICGSGFNMKVAAFDPFVTADAMAAAGADKSEDLKDLAAHSDILSVHAPLSTATRGLVAAEIVAALPPHAVLVNTSRGGLVDETALIRALQENHIAGAGLDVFEREPPSPDNPLLTMTNVVLSPHVAGVTEDSLRGMAMGVVDIIDCVFAGKLPATLLNGDALKL